MHAAVEPAPPRPRQSTSMRTDPSAGATRRLRARAGGRADHELGYVARLHWTAAWRIMDARREFAPKLPMIRAYALGPDPGNALANHSLERMQVVLTTRCNLRCTYCNVSQPTYVGSDMAAPVFDAVVRDLEQRERRPTVWVNGHGETTMLPHWVAWVSRLLGLGVDLSIVSNFAAPLNDDEVRLLARFSALTVSIDTVDAELLAQIRRKVRLATIRENIERVKQAAAEFGIEGPTIALSVGLYDRSAAGLPALARFAVDAKVQEVWFWELKKYPDVAGVMNVQPIETMSAGEQRAALAAYREAESVLRGNGISVSRPDDLLRTLEAQSR